MFINILLLLLNQFNCFIKYTFLLRDNIVWSDELTVHNVIGDYEQWKIWLYSSRHRQAFIPKVSERWGVLLGNQ